MKKKMEIYHDCIVCQVRTAVDSIMQLTNNKKLIDEAIKICLIKISEFKTYDNIFDYHCSIQEVIKNIIPNGDPYKEHKKEFNKICMDFSREIKSIIDNSADKFDTSLRVCLAGNSIDVMQGKKISKEVIRNSITMALDQFPDLKNIKKLEKEIIKANKILFLGDNAGEIVFDKIFIELLNKNYDKEGKITYVVRGGVTLNDSTIKDASIVKMDEVAKVITTGIDIPFSYLPACSEGFRKAYNNSDLIISKGQGNFESLMYEDKNIFFLLKIKCYLIAKLINKNYKVDDFIVETGLLN